MKFIYKPMMVYILKGRQKTKLDRTFPYAYIPFRFQISPCLTNLSTEGVQKRIFHQMMLTKPTDLKYPIPLTPIVSFLSDFHNDVDC